MPVQVLVVVTTHNNIISHRPKLTTLEEKDFFPIFFIQKNIFTVTHLSEIISPTDPPRDALLMNFFGGDCVLTIHELGVQDTHLKVKTPSPCRGCSLMTAKR